MLVYKVLIAKGNIELGDVKVDLTRQQFAAVTQGGCDLWPEIQQEFSCPDLDLRAVAVLDPESNQWLSNLDSDAVDQYWPSIARELGFW